MDKKIKVVKILLKSLKILSLILFVYCAIGVAVTVITKETSVLGTCMLFTTLGLSSITDYFVLTRTSITQADE